MQQKTISGPVAIAVVVVVLLLICGGGYWYLNRPPALGPQYLAMKNQMDKTKPPAPNATTPNGNPGATH